MASAIVEVEPSVHGTTHVLVVRGEMDLSSVDTIQEPLDRALSASPETIVLDLSGVTFCDSSGVHLVVKAHRRAGDQKCHLVVVRPAGLAWRTFEICQIDRCVHFVDAAQGTKIDDGGALFRVRPCG